jgi:transcriptional regulator with XRE-family HTH domain
MEMTIAQIGNEDARMLMQIMPVHACDGARRDLASLDTPRLLSTAKPSRIRQSQARHFGEIGRSANILIASTGLMMMPSYGIAGTDVAMLAEASCHWIGVTAQPTGMTCQAVQVADSPAASSAAERQLHERLLTAPIAVLSREALAALGITKTQMASILGIERPHFYQWLKGGVTNPSKSGRLRDLLALLHRTGITPHDPLRSHLITEPLAPGAIPLVTQLAGNLKSPALASNLLQAASLNRTITREADERLARMRDRGHDTRIDQAALDTLDTTLTMTEWSRHDG